ncbi:MAG: hypothetical protein GY909_17845 [Oligoflexia bacterium]|nr:hypothetical protein [Oligoflexia bacterium]
MEFKIETQSIYIEDFSSIDFSITKAPLFLSKMYKYFFNIIIESNGIFQLNYDDLDHKKILSIIKEENPRALLLRLNGKKMTTAEWDKEPVRKAIVLFLCQYPSFGFFIKNLHTDVELNIKNAEQWYGENVNTENFLEIKKKVDRLNELRWNRDQLKNESQSGVSILGSISEALIEIAMESLIDGKTFFRSQHQDVKSYGDFVLMCLPNNLWLSVKSNFARERLLASGFTSDIIGVGYFTDFKEFTSQTKIRNFIKVGFLAMYMPDIPITPDQIKNGLSTYDEVQSYYKERNMPFPSNINGKPFLRPLTDLFGNLKSLIQIEDTSKRTIVNF